MAIHLTGNNLLQIPSTTIAANLTSLSACMWVNFRSIGSSDDHALLFIGPDNNNRTFSIHRDAVSASSGRTNCLTAGMGDGSQGSNLSSSDNSMPVSLTDQWVHVAVTWEAGFGFRIYIDGAADSEQGVDDALFSASSGAARDYRLGYSPGPWKTPDLWMAEHAFWPNTKLHDSEIAALAMGVSPLGLTGRIATLGVYQALVRGPGWSGVGPAFNEVGTVPAAEHPGVRFPGRALRGGRRSSLFPRLAAALASASGAESGEAFLSGVDAGVVYPFAEAIN